MKTATRIKFSWSGIGLLLDLAGAAAFIIGVIGGLTRITWAISGALIISGLLLAGIGQIVTFLFRANRWLEALSNRLDSVEHQLDIAQASRNETNKALQWIIDHWQDSSLPTHTEDWK